MSAFLPRTNSAAQIALTDQVSRGAASHLVLIDISGAAPNILAAVSRNMAARLRPQRDFIDVQNGDKHSADGITNYFVHHRYLLASNVNPEMFTVSGLHTALEGDISLLGTDIGGLVQSTLASDPTGEMLTLADQFQKPPSPRIVDGVWVSPDAKNALLLVTTRAPGFDVGQQQHALTLIQNAFASAKANTLAASNVQIRETGPGVFAVDIRNTTKTDVTRLSILASAGAVTLLFFAYRAPLMLVLGLLPVISGALAATAAVSLVFGFVHGVTLGFGVTLIGESLDYAIYLFTQTGRNEEAKDTLRRIWPILWLGAIISIIGFSAMVFSSFVGFSQLGLFSIVGLSVAICVTHFVLPALIPKGFVARGSTAFATPIVMLINHKSRLIPFTVLIVLIASTALMLHRGGMWDGNLQNLSPVPQNLQVLDQILRHDLHVPNSRYFAVFQANSEQHALQDSESIAPILQDLVAKGRLTSFGLPSSILPSERAQLTRQASLPDAVVLHRNLDQALIGLPFRPETFSPFFADVAHTRNSKLITQSSLPKPLSLEVQSMLMKDQDGWIVLAPLLTVSEPRNISSTFSNSPKVHVVLLDLNVVSANLLKIFQRDATTLACVGCGFISVTLIIGLRSLRRAVRVALPLASSVIVTASLLIFNDGKLSIFMVVGFLLIVAVGSNYCLFFERLPQMPEARVRALASVVLANSCTVSAYGLMSFSRIPVLHDIGATVAMGTFLTLLFGAIISTPRREFLS
ncbi:MAG: MMPL family transporter [Acidocella sp.]|nr:MMPL family transporter [Acidocella sp.]